MWKKLIEEKLPNARLGYQEPKLIESKFQI